MAFEGVQIHSLRNGGTPIDGYREDLVQGDTVLCSLTSSTGVSTFRWEIIGRPEGSVAGGSGPEPCSLGTGATGSFVVDTDAPPVYLDGSYLVQCTLNENTPTETRISAMLVRLNIAITPDGKPLRILAGYEVNQDTADPLVQQGYAKMINRWFRLVAAGGTPPPPAPADHMEITLRNDSGVTVPANRIVHFNTVNASGNGGFLVGLPTLSAERGIGVTQASIASGASGLVTIGGLATVFVIGYASQFDVLQDGPGHKVYLSFEGLMGTFRPPIGMRNLVIGERIDNVNWVHYGGGLVKILLRPNFDVSYTEEFNGDNVTLYNSNTYTTALKLDFRGVGVFPVSNQPFRWTGIIEATLVAAPLFDTTIPAGNDPNANLASFFKRTWGVAFTAPGNSGQLLATTNDLTYQGNVNADVRLIFTNNTTIEIQVKGAGAVGMNWACTAKVTGLLNPLTP
jgi:hypothetical protein